MAWGRNWFFLSCGVLVTLWFTIGRVFDIEYLLHRLHSRAVGALDDGDMMRSMTCAAAEDETNLSRVQVQMPLFEALTRGYLQAAGTFLTPVERANLVTAGKLITLEQGVRFLTDFLLGDTYYKIHRPNHNLDRCRAQFKLLESIIQHERQMVRFTDSL